MFFPEIFLILLTFGFFYCR